MYIFLSACRSSWNLFSIIGRNIKNGERSFFYDPHNFKSNERKLKEKNINEEKKETRAETREEMREEMREKNIYFIKNF